MEREWLFLVNRFKNPMHEAYSGTIPDTVRYCCMCRTEKWGWRVALILFRAIHLCLNIKISCLAGTEGELQLRPLLSASEWKSREIPRRGTPPRRLSIQWTRRVLGGKERRSLFSFFIFLLSPFSRPESSANRSC